MPKRVRRKDLKGPDEFLSFTQRALEYARQNEREVTIVVLALVGVVAVALGIRGYRSWQLGRAVQSFGRAYQEFAADHLERAADGFTAVASAWPGTPQGELALLYLGNCYADLRNDSAAKAAFTDLLAGTNDEGLRQIARYNLGVLKQKTGDTAGAAEEFHAAAATAGPLRGVAWFAGIRMQGTRGQSTDVASEHLGGAPGDGLFPEAREYAAAMLSAGSAGK